MQTLIFSYQKYSGQKKKIYAPEGAKYFSLMKGVNSFGSTPISLQLWQKRLSHYYRGKYFAPSVVFYFIFIDHCIQVYELKKNLKTVSFT